MTSSLSYSRRRIYWSRQRAFHLEQVYLYYIEKGEKTIVYHVCTYKKLQKYLRTKAILPPVRAWENIAQAERMSISTGRRLILRLKFPNNAEKLEGHFNQARVIHEPYELNNI